MRFYIPTQAITNTRFSESYKKLLQEGIVKDMSDKIKHNHNVCATDSSSVEFNHNKFIQQKYFNTEFYRSSKPLYIWEKDKRLHVSLFDGSLEKVKLLEVSLTANDPDLIWGIFYIIEFSYWTDYTIQQILPWIDRFYATLRSSYMSVIRLPSVIKMNIAPVLLKLGNCYSHMYYIWNGNKTDVYNQLVFIRDNYLNSTHASRRVNAVNLKKYHDDIDESILVLNAISESPVVTDVQGEVKENTIFNEPLENVDKLFEITIPDPKRIALADFARELIDKLGPVTAANLAQEILHKVVV